MSGARLKRSSTAGCHEIDATQVERLQYLFELSVGTRMLQGYAHALPAAVGEGGELEQAFEKALNDAPPRRAGPILTWGTNRCLTPGSSKPLACGLPLDAQLELAHECSKVAETYPTLTPERRAALLEMRRRSLDLGIAREVFGNAGE